MAAGLFSGGQYRSLEIGGIRHFGDHDISKITTRMSRDYLTQFDKTRGKPLAELTRAKHVIVIRKVLSLAVGDGLRYSIPVERFNGQPASLRAWLFGEGIPFDVNLYPCAVDQQMQRAS